MSTRSRAAEERHRYGGLSARRRRQLQERPERRFAYRWHPNAVDTNRDYSKEPMTLVEFTLEDAPGGTLLKLVESGFDAIPLDRRAEALRGNDQGWSAQMTAIEKYLRAHP